MDNNATDVSTMSQGNIKNYQQMLLNVFVQKLQENEKQIKIFMDYKKSHKKVIEGLQVFPLSVSENCMVPIGKRALMKGKLTHTNEILVSLGSGYFAKYSASQAIALCNRRISWADEMLKSLEDERNLYEMKQIFPMQHDVFAEQDRKDILEHWNEEKLEEWKEQHRQREKEYHQKRTKLREKEEADTRTDEDIFNRLDELELQEELENEIYSLENERKRFYGDDLKEGEVYEESEEDCDDNDDEDDDSSLESNDITIEMLQEELKKLKDIRINKIANISSVPNSNEVQTEIIDKDNIGNKQSNPIVNSTEESMEYFSDKPNDISKSTDVKEKRRVSFVEPCNEDHSSTESEVAIFQESYAQTQDDTYNNKNIEDDIIKIEFSHSSHIPNIPKSSNTENMSQSNSTEILSPTDIYKMFNVPKKSILKRSPNDMVPNQLIPPPNEDSSTDTENEDADKSSAYCSVMKDIQEKKAISANNTIEKEDKPKLVSRFKMNRVGMKK